VSAIHPVLKSEVSEEQKYLFTLASIPQDYCPVTRKDIPGVPLAFILENVLSPSECDFLINSAETVGYSYWDSRENARKDFRDADTIECTHLPLADLLWTRMRPFVQTHLELDSKHNYYQSDLQGKS